MVRGGRGGGAVECTKAVGMVAASCVIMGRNREVGKNMEGGTKAVGMATTHTMLDNTLLTFCTSCLLVAHHSIEQSII